jgi:hypothetical protein
VLCDWAAVVVNSTYDGEYAADTGPRAQRKSIGPHKSRERLGSRVVVVEGEELPLLNLDRHCSFLAMELSI